MAALVLVAAGLAGSHSAGASSAPVATGGPPLAIPASGAYLGAIAAPDGSQNPSTFAALNQAAGGTLGMDRVYDGWDTTQPDALSRWDVQNGVVPVVSIDANADGQPLPWAAIASGRYDTDIVAQAEGLASLHSPVILAFGHEPELDRANGDPADYVAAFRHYVEVFRSKGVTNVSFAIILIERSYDSGSVSEWYPGDSYVDWVGVDGYNANGCHTGVVKWEPFSTIFAAFDAFAAVHAKPGVIAEFGSSENPTIPGAKAQWIADAATTIESWPQIKAALYFDAPGADPSCGWPLTTSESAASAFASVAGERWFAPQPVASLAAPTSSGPAPLPVRFVPAVRTGIDGPVAQWSVDFGDGSSPETGVGAPPSVIDHSYQPGSYTAVLQVADADGDLGRTSLDVVSFPAPSVGHLYSKSLQPTSVELTGWVTPGGLVSSYRFEWGVTPHLGSTSPVSAAGVGTTPMAESFAVGGLQPSTDYYWALEATNSAGTTTSPVKEVHTPK